MQVTAAIACFLFAFSLRGSTGAYLIGLIALCSWLYRHRALSAPALPHHLYSAAYGLIAVVLIHACITVPGTIAPTWQTIDNYLDYILLLVFIPLSAVFFHLRRQLYWILLFPAVVVVIRVLHRTDWNALDQTLFGLKQYGFGIHRVSFGLHCSAAVIILAAALMHSGGLKLSKAKRGVLLLVLASMLVLLLQALLASGARSGWLSAIAGVLIVTFFTVLQRVQASSFRLSRMLWRGALTCAVLAGLVVFNGDGVMKRVHAMTNVDFEYTFDVSKLPRDKDLFFARRVHLIFFGIERIQERPLLGFGPATVSVLLQADPDFRRMPHLHNTYIQTVVEIGVIGTLAISVPLVLLAGYFLYAVFARWRVSALQDDILLPLIIGGSCAIALWAGMDNHLHQADFRFLATWYAALAALVIRLDRAGAQD